MRLMLDLLSKKLNLEVSLREALDFKLFHIAFFFLTNLKPTSLSIHGGLEIPLSFNFGAF